jgi:hypothetical protein
MVPCIRNRNKLNLRAEAVGLVYHDGTYTIYSRLIRRR